MIYTCYEMIRDCRENRPEGWRYLISNYVPVIRNLVTHYGEGDEAVVERVVLSLRNTQASLFQSLAPAPERWFVAELRQHVLAQMVFPTPEIALDLDSAAAALAPLTVVEKQASWTEGMRYTPEQTAAMLRMSSATVTKIRDRAAELLRGHLDAWHRGILNENGPQLSRAAAAAGGKDCLSAKVFLDVLDGRATWSGREQMERHVSACLHCIDHFCRMAEVIELLRGIRPLSEAEAAPFFRLLGVAPEKRKPWRRLIGV